MPNRFLGWRTIMKNKYESCDDECKNVAKWECELCGTKYCDECASNADYTCDCEEPPHLIKIKQDNAQKSTTKPMASGQSI
jgi:hypothetical protein